MVDKAMTEKVSMNKAEAMKVAVVKATVDTVVTKATSHGAAAVRTTTGLVGFGSGSSPGPTVGSKRAVVPGGFTPLSMWFYDALEPKNIEQLCSRQLPFILFILYLIQFFVD
jgi:hypothetical protein